MLDMKKKKLKEIKWYGRKEFSKHSDHTCFCNLQVGPLVIVHLTQQFKFQIHASMTIKLSSIEVEVPQTDWMHANCQLKGLPGETLVISQRSAVADLRICPAKHQ